MQTSQDMLQNNRRPSEEDLRLSESQKKNIPIENPEQPRKTIMFDLCCDCWVLFMVSLWKIYGQKIHRIILLQVGLITFLFYYARDRKPRFSWFLDFGRPWEPWFVDLDIPSYFKSLRTNPNSFSNICYDEFIICNFETLKCGNLGILTIWNLETLKFPGVWKFEAFDCCIVCIVTFRMLKSWK